MASQYKKKVKPGILELDPNDSVLIVNIETQVVDTTQYDSEGRELVVQTKPGQKRVKLNTFNENSDIQRFADEIVKQVKYIHPKKVGHVCDLLQQLRNRQRSNNNIDNNYSNHNHQNNSYNNYNNNYNDNSYNTNNNSNNTNNNSYNNNNNNNNNSYNNNSSYNNNNNYNDNDNSSYRPMHSPNNNTNRTNLAPINGINNRQLPFNDLKRSPSLEELQEKQRLQQLEEERQLRMKRANEEKEKRQAEMEAKRYAEALAKKAEMEKKAAEEEYARLQQLELEQKLEREKYESTIKHRHEQWNSRVMPRSRSQEELDLLNKRKKQLQLIPPFGDEQMVGRSPSPHSPNRSPRSPLNSLSNDKSIPDLSNMQAPSRRRRKTKKKKQAKASMKKIDLYFSKLYEDSISDKLKGCQMLLQLVQDPNNLEYFIENETMLGALTRILSEDRKKSTELTTTILEIFFCFSSFKQLHHILIKNRIGGTTIKIIELELKRYQHHEANKKNDDPIVYQQFLAKQEKLLYVCFYILLNLAEDIKIEYLMTEAKVEARSININEQLIRMLKRDDSRQSPGSYTEEDKNAGVGCPDSFLDELHLLIVTFLKKLSIFKENKDTMNRLDILRGLKPFFYRRDADLRVAVMRLIYNLSFDSDLRQKIIDEDLLTFFVHAMKAPQAQATAMRLLYNISCDYNHIEDFCENMRPSANVLAEIIISAPGKWIDEQIVALAINLSIDALCCEAMCGHDGNLLYQMIKRVHQTLDPNLMKLIRNISEHDENAEWCARPLFIRYMHQFVGMMMKTPLVEFLVEVTACLNNIQQPDYMYSELIAHHSLLEFVMKHLAPGFVDDDIILEMIMLIGTFAIDPNSAHILAEPRLIMLLYDLLVDKQDDEDMTVQLTYTLMKMLLQEATRRAITAHQQLPGLLLDLVVDANKDVRRYANICMDIIMFFDEDEWRDRIREKRFVMCNQEWLDAITGGSSYLNVKDDSILNDSDVLDDSRLHINDSLDLNDSLNDSMNNEYYNNNFNNNRYGRAQNY